MAKKVRLINKGQEQVLDTSSQEYRQLFESGQIFGQSDSDTLFGGNLDEVIISPPNLAEMYIRGLEQLSEEPKITKDSSRIDKIKARVQKDNPYEAYKSMVQGTLPSNAINEANVRGSYQQNIDEKVAQALLDENPFEGRYEGATKTSQDRRRWYDSFTPEERQLIQGHSSTARQFGPALTQHLLDEDARASREHGVIGAYFNKEGLRAKAAASFEKLRIGKNQQGGWRTVEDFLNMPAYISSVGGRTAMVPTNISEGNYLEAAMPFAEAAMIGFGAKSGQQVLKNATLPLSGAELELGKGISKGLKEGINKVTNKINSVREILDPKLAEKTVERKRALLYEKEMFYQERAGYRELSDVQDRLDAYRQKIRLVKSVADSHQLEGKNLILRKDSKGIWQAVNLDPKHKDLHGGVLDLQTGALIPYEDLGRPEAVEGFNLLTREKISTQGTKVVFPKDSPQKVTLRSNIDFAEKTFEGKAFGGAVAVSKGGLLHFTGDLDMLITRDMYEKNVAKVLPLSQKKKIANEHIFTTPTGRSTKIDFAIIDKASDGTATGSIANQLYRQFDPDGYFKQARLAIKNGTDLHIPYTPEELLAKVDPLKKTLMDVMEAGYRNGKHINRIDVLFATGDSELILETQEQFIKSVVGSKGKVAPDMRKHFNNPEQNKQLLKEIDYIGDFESLASDPNRMQIVLNDWYFNNSVVSRGVTDRGWESVYNGFTYSDPRTGGGRAQGAGLNAVLYGESDAGNIYGNIQLKFKLNTESPQAFVKSVRDHVDGNIPFTPEIQTKIDQLKTEFQIRGEIRTPTEFIKAIASRPDEQVILNGFYDITDMRAVRTGAEYGNSYFISLTKEIDELVEPFMYAARSHDAAIPKSLEMRRQNLGKQNIRGNSIPFDELWRAKRLIEDGSEVFYKRYQILLAEENVLSDRFYSPLGAKKRQWAERRMQEVKQEREQLAQHLRALEQKREDLKIILKIAGVGGGIGGVTGIGLNEATKPKPPEERCKEAQKLLEEEKKLVRERIEKGQDPTKLPWYSSKSGRRSYRRIKAIHEVEYELEQKKKFDEMVEENTRREERVEQSKIK